MQKHDIRAVFFDIDGTLLSFKTHQVSQSTQQAISALQAKGIKTILATGRAISSIHPVEHLDFDGYITFNGGLCLSKTKEVLFRKCIDPRDIQAVIDYAKNQPLSFSFMGEKQISIYRVTPEVASMYKQLNLPVPAELPLDRIDTQQILQANIFLPPSQEADFMQEIMPHSIASRWTDLFADVNPAGLSKENGVEVFCQQLGISPEQCMAFGDGGNDMSMLKRVGIGVAMGNANPAVKAVADFTSLSVDEDGIAHALKVFGLL